jgi:hypothetical protein
MHCVFLARASRRSCKNPSTLFHARLCVAYRRDKVKSLCLAVELITLVAKIEMASFEDYDEFGNYIGADLESDEEDEIQRDQFLRQEPQQRETVAPLEGYEEEAEEPAGVVGMEVDGMPAL